MAIHNIYQFFSSSSSEATEWSFKLLSSSPRNWGPLSARLLTTCRQLLSSETLPLSNYQQHPSIVTRTEVKGLRSGSVAELMMMHIVQWQEGSVSWKKCSPRTRNLLNRASLEWTLNKVNRSIIQLDLNLKSPTIRPRLPVRPQWPHDDP